MYDACQLLLGTLVFTVLFFLSPTIAVYYTFFCIVQAVALGGQVCATSSLLNEKDVTRGAQCAAVACCDTNLFLLKDDEKHACNRPRTS